MKYRDLSDADFDLELARTQEAYYQAYRVAKLASPTLEVMQGRWDKCNAWNARLNELRIEEQRRALLISGQRWLDQEIGI